MPQETSHRTSQGRQYELANEDLLPTKQAEQRDYCLATIRWLAPEMEACPVCYGVLFKNPSRITLRNGVQNTKDTNAVLVLRLLCVCCQRCAHGSGFA